MATYKPFEYKTYTPSNAVSIVGNNKRTSQNAYDSYMNTGYQMSDDVIQAGLDKTDAENAVKIYDKFTYDNQDAYKDVMEKILGREDFSYDLNGDMLYQQYKDRYITQGKMAMQDTMGQAAAMTGGYGSSYAASVGNQAYQASLQQLNDIVPQLYQMALDRYNQQGQDLYNQYGMLSNDRSTKYGEWSDGYNRAVADRDYYSDNYNNAYNMDYGQWADKGNMLSSNRDYWSGEYTDTFNRDYGQYSDNRNLAFNEHQVAEGARQHDDTMAFNREQANKTTTTSTSAPTLSASEYNEVLINAKEYADPNSGGSKEALENYLRGLMARGLSEGEANAIRQQYFPTELKPDDRERPRNYVSVFDKLGINFSIN